jgi:acyl carrier protein
VATILDTLNTIIRHILRDPDIDLTPTTRFEDLAGWDSMDLVSVVVEVECHFDIQFELAELDRLTTAADLLDMVAAKRALAAA